MNRSTSAGESTHSLKIKIRESALHLYGHIDDPNSIAIHDRSLV